MRDCVFLIYLHPVDKRIYTCQRVDHNRGVQTLSRQLSLSLNPIPLVLEATYLLPAPSHSRHHASWQVPNSPSRKRSHRIYTWTVQLPLSEWTRNIHPSNLLPSSPFFLNCPIPTLRINNASRVGHSEQLEWKDPSKKQVQKTLLLQNSGGQGPR